MSKMAKLTTTVTNIRPQIAVSDGKTYTDYFYLKSKIYWLFFRCGVAKHLLIVVTLNIQPHPSLPGLTNAPPTQQ